MNPWARSCEFTYCKVAELLSSLDSESVVESSSGLPGSLREASEGDPSVSNAQCTSFFAIVGGDDSGEANELHGEEEH